MLSWKDQLNWNSSNNVNNDALENIPEMRHARSFFRNENENYHLEDPGMNLRRKRDSSVSALQLGSQDRLCSMGAVSRTTNRGTPFSIFEWLRVRNVFCSQDPTSLNWPCRYWQLAVVSQASPNNHVLSTDTLHADSFHSWWFKLH
jgi:hypothetical protein